MTEVFPQHGFRVVPAEHHFAGAVEGQWIADYSLILAEGINNRVHIQGKIEDSPLAAVESCLAVIFGGKVLRQLALTTITGWDGGETPYGDWEGYFYWEPMIDFGK